jgi:transketolase
LVDDDFDNLLRAFPEVTYMTDTNNSYTQTDLDRLAINTIRFLSIDAIQKANSGHPGLPMGAASMAYVLWTRYLKHNPNNPVWFNRDRFILSAGHGSMLLYSLLYLTGYNLPLEQIKNFRQWGSHTPGHPERGVTPGVEVTTGPLGQGFGNGVGMAIAEAFLAARFNRPGFDIIDHDTYSIVSDGDLMEGVSSETASLAGHLKLGKLIYLYDNNYVSLSSSTQLTFTEERAKRFQSFGWHTQIVDDGNDLAAIDRAIRISKAEKERPSLILIHTHLGYGSPNKQDTFEAHGSPLGEEEVKLTKQNLGWPLQPDFYVPEEVLKHYRKALETGKQAEEEWKASFAAYRQSYPDLARELGQIIRGELPEGWDRDIPEFTADQKAMATRVASGTTLHKISARVPNLMGGSCDLDPSTHTMLAELGDLENPAEAVGDLQGSAGGGWSYAGRNLHFGVREHGMGAILNGLAAHGGLIPFGATFLIFSDYMRPPIRLAALSHLHVIYVFTHDSIGLGEDGPTHQSVEQLIGLRAIPNMVVIRPADANETAEAWRVALSLRDRPVALALTRQKIPILDLKDYPAIRSGVERGAYVLAETPGADRPEIILVATGSEVQLALGAREKLAQEGIRVRVVSMPSWNLFMEQSEAYRRSVFPDGVQILAIEAGVSLGWRSYIDGNIDVIGVDRFGASAPGEVMMHEYGFSIENVIKRARTILERQKESM